MILPAYFFFPLAWENIFLVSGTQEMELVKRAMGCVDFFCLLPVFRRINSRPGSLSADCPPSRTGVVASATADARPTASGPRIYSPDDIAAFLLYFVGRKNQLANAIAPPHNPARTRHSAATSEPIPAWSALKIGIGSVSEPGP